MTPLHRHQIARLSPAGWARVIQRPWDAPAAECLAHWASHGLPLVVTRQEPGAASHTIAMGLPAPTRWGRLHLSLRVPRTDVLYFDEFPCADKVTPLLPEAALTAWRQLCARLKACDAVARVYGSYGWQRLSGLDHVRSSSDIDLWVAVSHLEQADAVAAALNDFAPLRPRVDGELVFGGDTAVAWREWRVWRTGRAKALLAKTIAGSSLVRSVVTLDTTAALQAET